MQSFFSADIYASFAFKNSCCFHVYINQLLLYKSSPLFVCKW